MLVAALLLIATGPWMPVLCIGPGHFAVEMPYSACCGAKGGSPSETPREPLMFSLLPASDCRDCTDTPLISAWPPAAQRSVSLEAAPASITAGLELPSEFSAILVLNGEVCEPSSVFASRPGPLRC